MDKGAARSRLRGRLRRPYSRAGGVSANGVSRGSSEFISDGVESEGISCLVRESFALPSSRKSEIFGDSDRDRAGAFEASFTTLSPSTTATIVEPMKPHRDSVSFHACGRPKEHLYHRRDTGFPYR